MMEVLFRLVTTCLWCDKEMEGIDGKMICSKKCLKEMNKEHPESNYTIDDVSERSKQS
jgi:hypothetical protein